MIALRLETVFVGDEGDCVLLAIGSVPRDRSSHHQDLVLGAGVLHFGFLRPRDTVAGFVTENVINA